MSRKIYKLMVSQGAAVHIVIPNYNGIRFLSACLTSIERQNFSSCEITVVDNGSSDDSLEYLRTSHPQVRCIALPENRGFSAAVNVGIMVGSAPYVFLLNNDTELPVDCVDQLVRTADKLKEFDFFVPKMLSYHERKMLDGAGDGFLRGGAGYRLGTMEKDSAVYNQAGPVFGACAGAVLYRRSLFDQVGLFDEDFFAYLEDVDLNLRINRAGLCGYYVPAAVVYHIGSATSGSKINAFTIRLSTRNSFFVLLKNYQLSLFLRLLPVIFIYQFCWFLFVIKNQQFFPYVKGMGQALAMIVRMSRKGRQLRENDRLTTSQLAVCLKNAEKSVVDSIMRRRLAQGKDNLLLRFYASLFL